MDHKICLLIYLYIHILFFQKYLAKFNLIFSKSIILNIIYFKEKIPLILTIKMDVFLLYYDACIRKSFDKNITNNAMIIAES